MTDDHDELSLEELAKLAGEPLPFRTAMSALIPPPPLGADPRLVDGGVHITSDAVSPKTPDEHIPETNL